MNMQQIKQANAAKGGCWFEASTMRFFRSKVGTKVYEGPGGVYFLSSEQFVSPGYTARRLYSVRQFDPDTGDISTVGEFNKMERGEAQATARRLAKG